MTLPANRQGGASLPQIVTERKGMLIMPEVKKALSPVEFTIFEATTKTPIQRLPVNKMVEQVAALSKFICRDIGLKQQLDEYERVRFFDILKKYYGEMTLHEVKTAFELSMVGELDAFLTKNGQGEPDRHHYQQFSVEYVTKILNAYRRKKRVVLSKAFNALPAPKSEATEEQKKRLRRQFLKEFYLFFLRYKYTGRFDFTGVLDLLIYSELARIGFVDDNIEPTDKDRTKAYFETLQKASEGLINKWEAMTIEQEGRKNKTVTRYAIPAARIRRIRETFDAIIKNEIQLINYLKV